MSKHLFANEKVMKQYLSALLQEEPEVQDCALSPVAKLLEQVKDPDVEQEIVPAAADIKPTTIESMTEVQEQEVSKFAQDLEVTENTSIIKEQATIEATSARDAYQEGEFQALFFEVAGLTLAVPLKSLGGIHQLGEVNQLFGKPKWFRGVMLNREEKLNVVDTAMWVMPEKLTPELQDSLNYQYLIMLGDSSWGLLAEKLVNNLTLKPEDIKWRTSDSKRPWLAGVIKEKMCALIDVENLNRLLEQGLDSREQ
ncbi:chemotaxis protein CheW [Pseudoalteromonas sp. McH1-7]|uniref:Purine-binding chemotaxis protein CheW n=1 Tax=Pseudoalteromonas peptidolytica F12-50-A1 TaxID=1315280 RepID=A0A8I0MVZ7_9GAMM|nr:MULTISPECIES: chemotaxis protein CheW [Pseudoalteromonas]MBE0346836.1 purine-binding chemotaxis protein CheW [Pseudoalteromonas peptidolytica F12-50-A1]MDW7550005.1 chemotaxis protein CheW [Pseudoalteromonas peptidolytica]NLR13739.1 chemotaxis protein CheW [Pseudoalteromonas peptidolytica]NUZ09544.1 chemotaxis protein CheW [Pseudoalteromonas sp. McH1-7]RRS08985.1 chemotaxis protein CheW [Pseudoalteromonas sp. J010]